MIIYSMNIFIYMNYLTTSNLREKFCRLSKENLATKLKGKQILFDDLELTLEFVNTEVTKRAVIIYYKFHDLRNPGKESKVHINGVYDTLFLDNLANSLGVAANNYRTNPDKFDSHSL